MIKKILYFLLFSITLSTWANEGYFKVFNKKLMEESITLKVVKFDTIPGWINYYNQRSQAEIQYRLLRSFQFGINESSSYEVFNHESPEIADINIHFNITDLYAESDNLPENLKEDRESNYGHVKLACGISMIGYSSVTKEKVFETEYTDNSVNLDEDSDSEILDMLHDLLNDIDNKFDDLSDEPRLKTYQKYNFKCNMVDTIHYFFIANHKIEAVRTLYSVVDAEINQNAAEENVDIFKIYFDSTTSIISEKNITTKKTDGFLSDSLQNYLLNRNIRSLLLFNNLQCRLPNTKFNDYESDRGGMAIPLILPFPGGVFVGSFGSYGDDGGTAQLNVVLEPTIDLYLVDVVHNKRLIATSISAYGGDHIAEKALMSIGILNPYTGEVNSCYDFDFD